MPASVLVVDDDPDIRDVLSDILRDEGFNVGQASNGAEALAHIGREPPDLVILDLMMPVMNGWEVLQALKRSETKIPVVVLSALGGEGCDDFVQKPISLDRLLMLMDKVRTASMRRTRAASRS